MGNMPDLQRVIDALTNCLDDFAPCRDCAYHDERKPELCGGVSNLMQDCLTLLESMVPRVMSLEEAKAALKDRPVIWLEVWNEGVQAAIRKKSYYETQTDEVIVFNDLDVSPACDGYGKEYRMWTACPTEAQRKAAKWIA